jgi:hypothetical protein
MRFAIKMVCGLGEANAHFAEYIINKLTNSWNDAPNLSAKLDTPIGANPWSEALMAVAGVGWQPSARKLGRWLAANQDIIDEGLVIRGKEDKHSGYSVWWIDEAGFQD